MPAKNQHKGGGDGNPDPTSTPEAASTNVTSTNDGAAVDSSVPPSGETYLFHCRAAPYSKLSYAFKGIMAVLILCALRSAYQVRLLSVQIYGYLIHEFDPWFNYRAAEYMSTHGWSAFFSWFDYMSWYPLGRPVGSTTYPGLQLTAVAIHRALAAAGMPMSLNNVCVLMPAWFGAIATATLALIAFEVSESICMAAWAALSFSIIPAHLMRSMAGEFDNECIAVAAMLLTFYCWVRSLRTRSSWPIGVLTGVAYGYMVAAWGGYIFVLNMVAMHAGISSMVDWARNTYNPSLLRAYTLFYVVGTAIAVCVPPVGMSPFKSLEQLGALLVLVFLCGLQACEVFRARAGVEVRSRANFKIRVRVFSVMAGVAALAIAVLAPTGYFGPLSVRVRALFVEHTRTGNPLVDSVAEHHPADALAYLNYLHIVYFMWIFSFPVQLILPSRNQYAVLFVFVYSFMAYYFSTRMVRLLILAGPAACLGASEVGGTLMEWCFQQLFWDDGMRTADMVAAGDMPYQKQDHASRGAGARQKQQKQKPRQVFARDSSTSSEERPYRTLIPVDFRRDAQMNRWSAGKTNAALIVALTIGVLLPIAFVFHFSCVSSAYSFAGPRIVFQTQLRTGEQVIVKDYLEAYEWLRDNTPEDARILAWWDYGYQITGIGNRTSLADGNTWNHEHIATIGKMLTSPVAEAHSLVRHMADYVLIWAGQSGDLMKSPHMARIGNSVYHDICPHDPLCQQFGFYRNDYSRPTPMMRASLLYNLHEVGKTKGVKVDPSLFQEVYSSKYGLVRVFKVMNVSEESKEWVADPANRVCHPPGSWICPGQYPPAKEIQEMLAHRVPFDQVGKDKKDKEAYHKAYMERSRTLGEV
ncbi:Oligosaccharyl transferase STT3 subunit family protein [Leishmania donovani]|uniref:dolichyl-diphosphooligosaccharide--protein glycotransferase n=1 Tax=Leishmania donovani TaxID=5661 RepID=A0A504X5S7_LEIDO|nr:Oligosaccharyl transferase STT3 subunit family protein [Leishmania donovani]